MRGTFHAPVWVSVSAFALAATATAQTPVQNPWTARIGIDSLTRSNAKSLTEDKGLLLGLSYELGKKALLGESAKPYVEFDFANHDGDGGKLSRVFLGYGERYFFPTNSTTFAPYAGLAIGLTYVDVDGRYGPSGGGGYSAVPRPRNENGIYRADERAFTYGVKLMLGAKFAQRYSIEAGYAFNGEVDEIESDSFTLTLGISF